MEIEKVLSSEIPKPEDVLRGLRKKAYALAGAEDPESVEVLKEQIKKQKTHIEFLEKERDTYQTAFQKELALVLEIERLARRGK